MSSGEQYWLACSRLSLTHCGCSSPTKPSNKLNIEISRLILIDNSDMPASNRFLLFVRLRAGGLETKNGQFACRIVRMYQTIPKRLRVPSLLTGPMTWTAFIVLCFSHQKWWNWPDILVFWLDQIGHSPGLSMLSKYQFGFCLFLLFSCTVKVFITFPFLLDFHFMNFFMYSCDPFDKRTLSYLMAPSDDFITLWPKSSVSLFTFLWLSPLSNCLFAFSLHPSHTLIQLKAKTKESI